VPEPGLSLIRLAEGNAAGANASLRRALADERSRPARARLLPAQVEAAVAAGDLATAREAMVELEGMARSFGTSALLASARHARGSVALAEGDFASATAALREALELWQKLEAPYEAAQTRVVLARAARAAGDDERARDEFGAAKAIFERIGARRDARIASGELGEHPELAPSEAPRVTRTFLFTDIVDSTKLIGVIGDDAWQDVIRWHDDALRAIIAEHRGEEIRHQGDGLVVSFADPGPALEAAIAIQRRLAEHRRTHGFAPPVRIGVHQTAATQRGLDYAGVGVHEAARVGALAGGGEILVTRATLDASKQTFATSGARTVELKGIAEPVEVLSVSWR
jgi:class 3 adenylate cyclase